MNYNIAIDGPAGAGKSTIAKKIAKELGFIYFDTGAMYRAIAYLCIQNGVTDEQERMEELCARADIRIVYEEGEQQIMLDGENITAFLRTEEVSNMASVVAANPGVREKLVEIQKNTGANENVVMDGRDIGTVVLPNADLKIYLTASSKTRALRRYKELTERQVACNIEDIEKDIIERDERDMTREVSPLRKAEDAVLVDTSDMGIDEVVSHILALYRDTRKA